MSRRKGAKREGRTPGECLVNARGARESKAVVRRSSPDRVIRGAALHLRRRLLPHHDDRIGKPAHTADVIPISMGNQHVPNRGIKLQRAATYPGHFGLRNRRVDDKRLILGENQHRSCFPKEPLEAFPPRCRHRRNLTSTRQPVAIDEVAGSEGLPAERPSRWTEPTVARRVRTERFAIRPADGRPPVHATA